MSDRSQPERDPGSARDEEAVRSYIEDLALTLTQLGMPRMPSRVFAALTASDSGRMNAAELAEKLSVSPAAISGAVRYLEQVGMVGRERGPGERRDHYRLYDDLWFASFLKRDRMMRMWRDATVQGVAALGADTPAGRRLASMADFLDFMVKEIPALFERWQQERDERERRAG
ncbi:GbsR/MarR family transcriptional regulator [Qaidamihabitans albus]|uniref:GbsR/MarR family transcriptional regulator n=1 Tax=Qaidamihabitans albus TaxID=2795733 RepID=UPI0018F1169B|nr:MarR family transcriptional regulator [Qaidamihabitans albus]